eukprot:CAMPEP_0116141698 /NCGR_PEP_ID=MMETSP0329-20121206/14517_1 /TAXON_ID=697910 /ORGANISM="Pseudo-nitzschia arenysensis, Strain B593" /LENGTH=162 /DNA_ID=CAMNT_0003636891 /DNA_START=70 /DNA_END=558 /DNA_ORIENTATION=-
MVSELSFSTYYEVMHSWERIRRVKDYDKTLGILVFSKFFSKHPDATLLFGIESDEGEWMKNDSFVPEAKKFVGWCDSFVDMLGPNTEMVSEIFAEEGRKHAKCGVKLEHYPSMGEALIEGVRTLDKKFNDDTELCWRKVYNDVTHDMGKAAISERTGRRHTM